MDLKQIETAKKDPTVMTLITNLNFPLTKVGLYLENSIV